MLYSLSEEAIRTKIGSREIKIGFIGLGRVGLPLAATLAAKGFDVTGVDIKNDIVARINNGESPYEDENGLPELIRDVANKKTLKATTSAKETGDCDMIIVSVPTLVRNEEPNIDALIVAANQQAREWRPGKTLVVQSTVPPFTTENVVAGIIEEKTGLKAGKDYGLAYSPERTQSPQVLQDLKNYPKVIGGIDGKSALIISLIYASFAPSIIDMGNIAAAELEKSVENTYRDVNIAFANELARLCELYGVDVYKIIAAANSQPFSHILSPGLVGGHCIPVVPYFIISDARKRGMETRLMQTARDLNESMFSSVVGMIDPGCRKVTVLGLSFKKDVRSFETSHTLKLARLLIEKGYDVTIHDPFLNGARFEFKTETDLYRSLTGSDCVILSTPHSEYDRIDFGRVKGLMRGNLIIDIRGTFVPEEVKNRGFKYKGFGRV